MQVLAAGAPVICLPAAPSVRQAEPRTSRVTALRFGLLAGSELGGLDGVNRF
jgi:hypothetical protein